MGSDVLTPRGRGTGGATTVGSFATCPPSPIRPSRSAVLARAFLVRMAARSLGVIAALPLLRTPHWERLSYPAGNGTVTSAEGTIFRGPKCLGDDHYAGTLSPEAGPGQRYRVKNQAEGVNGMGQGRANPTAVRIGQRTLAGLNRQRNRAGGILTRVARARNQRRRARPRAAVR